MLELNKVFLIGNLTQKPDARMLASGDLVAELRLAVNRRYKNRDGQPQEETLFIQVEAWKTVAKFCQDWLAKGRRIFVEGRLKMDTWEAKEGGGKRSVIKVVAERVQFADSRAAADSSSDAGEMDASANSSYTERDASSGSFSRKPSPYQGPSAEGTSRPASGGQPFNTAGPPASTDDDLPF
ncbi:MAG TPA: single-stranded DNA-binding protein [Candidatus Sumerlaeota bacterium]|nr:single-stranded DNA-binding protein [Candidatus Sumerlaeota bacterium]HRR30719.1 single-stranded DNA-binding protein [Candidatus Sumerlaeia bacterium]HON50497.1 single-stranded DNA-binding protein [Candidatus Sumerlaeota bacterium]HOR63712.1 single-stranded DNA-binding protein [Candidatus Sumerlaeota bacterium]HPL73680.1 single-stranded DNA-binding protein [Candidatus Sumerlaeota bacterium]